VSDKGDGDRSGVKLPPLYFDTMRDMVLFWTTFTASAIPIFYGLVSSFWLLVAAPAVLVLISGLPGGRRYGFVSYAWNGLWFGNLGAILLAVVSLLYR